MANNVDFYRERVVSGLKAANRYSEGLEMQVYSLASALRNLAMANEDIDALESTTVVETSRYGQKIAPHPAFKIAKEAQELVTRQMKALGLTADDLLAGDTEGDRLAELTSDLINAGAGQVIIRPDEKKK